MSSCRDVNDNEIVTFIINGENKASTNIGFAPVNGETVRNMHNVIGALFEKTSKPIKSIAVEQGGPTALNRKFLFDFDFVDGTATESKHYREVASSPEPPVYLRICVEGEETPKLKEIQDICTFANDCAFFELALTREECSGVVKFLRFMADHDIYNEVHHVEGIKAMDMHDYGKNKAEAIAFQRDVDNAVAEATL